MTVGLISSQSLLCLRRPPSPKEAQSMIYFPGLVGRLASWAGFEHSTQRSFVMPNVDGIRSRCKRNPQLWIVILPAQFTLTIQYMRHQRRNSVLRRSDAKAAVCDIQNNFETAFCCWDLLCWQWDKAVVIVLAVIIALSLWRVDTWLYHSRCLPQKPLALVPKLFLYNCHCKLSALGISKYAAWYAAKTWVIAWSKAVHDELNCVTYIARNMANDSFNQKSV